MRLFIFTLFLFITSCNPSGYIIKIPSNDIIKLDYADYKLCEVELKNASFTNIGVKVKSKSSDEFIRGFGLGMKAKEKVLVEDTSTLQLVNSSNRKVRVRISTQEKKAYVNTKTNTSKRIDFTLVNDSAKSIPLLIPTVMNPNLSPFSNSGVDLKIGQKILFKEGGKKYVLLVVDETIAQGDEINVAQLLKSKRKELGL